VHLVKRAFVGVVCITLLYAGGAWAQDAYPNRPVRLIVPFAPGGLADITFRMVGEKLNTLLGKQVIIENMPGAGGIAATTTVIRSKPDGHTLMVFSSGAALTKLLFKNVPYDVSKDIVPIAFAAHFDLIFVVKNDSRHRTLADLVNDARANPGSTQNLSAELLKTAANLDFTIVPFKTTPEAFSALLAGQVDSVVESYAAARALIESGRLRVLASTGAKRSGYLPSAPTMAEAGVPNFEVIGWNGLAGPAGTPPEIISLLHKHMMTIVAMPDIKKKLLDLGTEAYAGSPDEVRARLAADLVKWDAVIKRAGIQQQ
jgi:tripartite-type tricarboxylate transporter receptor subunit TctC